MPQNERPDSHHEGSATWWHSRIRYLFARRAAPGLPALDLACGNGYGTVILGETATSVVGADVSSEAIQNARRANARANVRYEAVSRPPFPFEAGSFGLIVSLETVEHMHFQDQRAFIAELNRLLRDDGVLVLSTPDRATERAYELAMHNPNPYHVHTPDRTEIEGLLSEYFPHRRSFLELDLVCSVVAAAREPLWEALGDARLEWHCRDNPAPVAAVWVCARTAGALAALDSATRPIAFRSDERLQEIERTLAADPTRLPAVEADEQILRVARLQEGVGTPSWWTEDTRYRFVQPLCARKRVLELGCRSGFGSTLLARVASHVTAVDTPERSQVAERLNHRDNVVYLSSTSSLQDDSFDVLVNLRRSSPDGKAVACLRAGGTRIRVVDCSDAPDEASGFDEADLVATVIVDVSCIESDLGRVEVENSALDRLPSTTRISVDSPAGSSGSSRPLVVVRGDFQRRAFAAEVISTSMAPDLSGLAPDERLSLLSSRMAVLENRIAALRNEVDDLRRGRPLISPRKWLRRIRDLVR